MMKIFENMRNDNALSIQSAKESGLRVVGIFCAYSPMELVIAAGAIPVSLCGTRQEPIAAAEKVLPRNLCPLIKSSYGFAVTDTCPYFRASEFIIAETTCDGKKKMFELLGQIKPVHVMHLPQGTNRSGAMGWWLEELYLLKERLEEHLGVTITNNTLRSAIKICNRERTALKNLHELNRLNPAPLTGLDMLTTIFVKGFNVDKEEGTG
jgi:benzoyl-CoA reductase/2-hydroxyglutaryl-CoA dehydratase subunit BcrC/BadD/HgdB